MESEIEEYPEVYKENKARLIFFFSGVAELIGGFIFFLLIRHYIFIGSQPLMQIGYVEFDVMLFFDLLFTMEMIVASTHIVAWFFLKFTENEKVPHAIKIFSICAHVLLIPLSSITDMVINLIIQ